MSKAYREDGTGQAEREWAGRNNQLYTTEYGSVIGSRKKYNITVKTEGQMIKLGHGLEEILNKLERNFQAFNLI